MLQNIFVFGIVYSQLNGPKLNNRLIFGHGSETGHGQRSRCLGITVTGRIPKGIWGASSA